MLRLRSIAHTLCRPGRADPDPRSLCFSGTADAENLVRMVKRAEEQRFADQLRPGLFLQRKLPCLLQVRERNSELDVDQVHRRCPVVIWSSIGKCTACGKAGGLDGAWA